MYGTGNFRETHYILFSLHTHDVVGLLCLLCLVIFPHTCLSTKLHVTEDAVQLLLCWMRADESEINITWLPLLTSNCKQVKTGVKTTLWWIMNNFTANKLIIASNCQVIISKNYYFSLHKCDKAGNLWKVETEECDLTCLVFCTKTNCHQSIWRKSIKMMAWSYCLSNQDIDLIVIWPILNTDWKSASVFDDTSNWWELTTCFKQTYACVIVVWTRSMHVL